MRFVFEDEPTLTLTQALDEPGAFGPRLLVERAAQVVASAEVDASAPAEAAVREVLQIAAPQEDVGPLQREFIALRRLSHDHLLPYGELFISDALAPAWTHTWVETRGWVAFVRRAELKLTLPPDGSAGSEGDAALDDSLEFGQIGEENSFGEGFGEGEGGDEAGGDEIGAIFTEMTRTSEEPMRPVSLDTVLTRLKLLLPQLISALEHLHRFKRAHGALTSHTARVGLDGRLHLTDYGLAALVPAHERAAPMAPERQDGQPPSAAADVYALGCLLYESVTGRPVFEGPLATRQARHREELPLSVLELEPECPSPWAELIHGALVKDPGERLRLDEVAAALARCGTTSTSVPPTLMAEPPLLVGRHDTLTTIVGHAQRTLRHGQLEVVAIEGATGCGKGLIVEHLCAALARQGWVILRGRCDAPHAHLFEGWHHIMDRLAVVLGQSSPQLRQTLRADVQVVRHLFAQLGEPAEDARQPSRSAALAALRRLLARLSQERPLLITFEGVDQASEDTIESLIDLSMWQDPLRCCLILTAPEPLPPTLEQLWEALDPHRVSARGLSRVEAAQLMEVMTRHDGERHAVLDAVRGLDAPMPSLLKELLYEVQHRGSAPTSGAQSGDQQARVEALLRARVAEMSEEARWLLRVLALARAPLGLDQLAQAMEEMDEALASSRTTSEASIGKLCARRLAKRQTSRARRVPTYQISHDLARRAAIHGVEDEELAELHRAVARALADEPGPDAAAHRFAHFRQAQVSSGARREALKVLATPRVRYAPRAEAALRVWLSAHPAEDEADVSAAQLEGVWHACARCGAHKHAAQIIERQAAMAGSDAERVRLLARAAESWRLSGDLTACTTTLTEAFRAARLTFHRPWWSAPPGTGTVGATMQWWDRRRALPSPSPAPSPDTLRPEQEAALEVLCVALDAWPEIESDAAWVWADQLRALAASAPTIAAQRASLSWDATLGAFGRWPRDAHLASAKLKRAKALPEATREARWQLRVVEASMARHKGQLKRAYTLLTEGLDEATAEGALETPGAIYMAAERAQLGMAQGDPQAVASALRHLRRIARHMAPAQWAASRILCEDALRRGDLIQAQRTLERLSELTREHDASWWAVWCQLTRARLNLGLGRPEVAVGQLNLYAERHHRSPLLRTGQLAMRWAIGHAQALVALFEREGALGDDHRVQTRQHVRAARARLRQLQHTCAPLLIPTLHRTLARLELALGRPSQAMSHVERAIEAATPIEAPLEHALCAEALALLLLDAEREEGRPLLAQARALQAHCGAQFPLIQEGWPIPVEATALRDEG